MERYLRFYGTRNFVDSDSDLAVMNDLEFVSAEEFFRYQNTVSFYYPKGSNYIYKVVDLENLNSYERDSYYGLVDYEINYKLKEIINLI